uniref:Uncharacterized protein n=1 Tax=Sus scrofa TaxID=9823 RepID=A0A8D0VMC7_PIG
TGLDCFDMSKKVGLKGGRDRMAVDVLDPLRQVLDVGMQSNKLDQRLWPLAFLVSLPKASVVLARLPPLRFHGMEVSQKMALSRPRIRVLFVFPLLGHSHSIWMFLGQGSNPSQICDLLHRCSDAGSFTHHAWLGAEPVTPQK